MNDQTSNRQTLDERLADNARHDVREHPTTPWDDRMHKVREVPPEICGEYDPPMQEWIQLPISEDGCPGCGSKEWGTMNPWGYFAVRRCHGTCGMKFRAAADLYMIREVVNALLGFGKRFAG